MVTCNDETRQSHDDGKALRHQCDDEKASNYYIGRNAFKIEICCEDLLEIYTSTSGKFDLKYSNIVDFPLPMFPSTQTYEKFYKNILSLHEDFQ